jgi:hypothetical protein
MKTFEFIILFFSFIFTLALTHLLLAVTRMIRHRRELIFSWEHALWMFNALVLLLANWLSLFDFRGQERFDLDSIVMLFVFVIGLYFACALVSPDFEDREEYDMREFHRREGPTYMGAIAVFIILAFIANIAATKEGVGIWGSENSLVAWMIPVVVLPLFVRNRWVQLACPTILLGLNIAFMVIFYPEIT